MKIRYAVILLKFQYICSTWSVVFAGNVWETWYFAIFNAHNFCSHMSHSGCDSVWFTTSVIVDIKQVDFLKSFGVLLIITRKRICKKICKKNDDIKYFNFHFIYKEDLTFKVIEKIKLIHVKGRSRSINGGDIYF